MALFSSLSDGKELMWLFWGILFLFISQLWQHRFTQQTQFVNSKTYLQEYLETSFCIYSRSRANYQKLNGHPQAPHLSFDDELPLCRLLTIVNGTRWGREATWSRSKCKNAPTRVGLLAYTLSTLPVFLGSRAQNCPNKSRICVS